MFMAMARIISQRSSCFRLNVGCIITIDNRPVSIGYNGPPAGEDHCRGNDCPLSSSGGCIRSLHAEANALNWYKSDEKSMTLYVTHSPCESCCSLILTRKVESVIYEAEYRITTGLDTLVGAGIKVYRLSPSGYLIDRKTNLVKDCQ